MSKECLREKLFSKFENVDEGILITDFLNKTNVIRDKWNTLRNYVVEEDDFFCMYPNLVKIVDYNNKKYLIVSFRHYSYMIMDITDNKVLNEDEVRKIFNQQFFLENLEEIKMNSEDEFFQVLDISYNDVDVQKVYDYVDENEEYFNINPNIFYKVYEENSEAVINLSLNKPSSILMFLTKDQYLYDHLFMNERLESLGMQDSVKKIGLDKSKEYFKRLKNIKIPYDEIDEKILNLIIQKEDNMTYKYVYRD